MSRRQKENYVKANGVHLAGIIAAQAMHAATKLGIADLLTSGPKSVAELAGDSGAHPSSLECLLRALSTLGVFAITPDGRFCNTPLSDVLRTDHPESQRASALFLPAAFLWRPVGELHETVRTGEPAFGRIFGQRFFDRSSPQRASQSRGSFPPREPRSSSVVWYRLSSGVQA